MKKLMSAPALLTVALLTVMAAPAFAQSFNSSYNNVPAYSQQQIPTDSSPRASEGGGA